MLKVKSIQVIEIENVTYCEFEYCYRPGVNKVLFRNQGMMVCDECYLYVVGEEINANNKDSVTELNEDEYKTAKVLES